MAVNTTGPGEKGPSNVPWSDFVKFVRQVSHDLRNHLNALELQAVFISELASEPELKTEVRRLRETIAGMTSGLQRLSVVLTDPRPTKIPYPAADLMNDLKAKAEKEFSDRKDRLKWEIEPGDGKIEVDPQLFQEAFLELLDNAFRFSPAETTLTVASRAAGSDFLMTLSEAKDFSGTPGGWGQQPLANVTHAHYSLGLNRVRAIMAAHGGRYQAEHDAQSRSLVTTIMLPLSRAEI